MRILEDWKEMVMDWLCPPRKSYLAPLMIGVLLFLSVAGVCYLVSQMSNRTRYRLKQSANSMMGDLRKICSCMGNRCHH